MAVALFRGHGLGITVRAVTLSTHPAHPTHPAGVNGEGGGATTEVGETAIAVWHLQCLQEDRGLLLVLALASVEKVELLFLFFWFLCQFLCGWCGGRCVVVEEGLTVHALLALHWRG